MNKTVQLTLRLPDSLFDWLKVTAKQAKRSTNAHISVCLTFLRNEQKAGRLVGEDSVAEPSNETHSNLFTFRTSNSLANWIKDEARLGNRSVNSQLVYALERVKRVMESHQNHYKQQVQRKSLNSETLIDFLPPAVPNSPYKRVAVQFPSESDLSKVYLNFAYIPGDLAKELEKLRLINRIQDTIEQVDVTQRVTTSPGFSTQTSAGQKIDVPWRVMINLDGDLIVSEPSGKYNAKIEDDLLRNAPVTVEGVQDVLIGALDAIQTFADDRLTDGNSDDGYQPLSADICSAIYAVHSLVADISDEDLRVESDDTPASNHNKRPKP